MDHEAITEWREEINRTGNTLADDILGQLIVTEDALLAERERVAKLRAALEWIIENRGYPLAFEAWKVAQQALSEGDPPTEDGEGG